MACRRELVACVLVVVLLPHVAAFRFIPEAFQSESFGSLDGQENGVAITVDGVGHVYVAGTTTASGVGQFGEIIVPVTMREADPADAEVFQSHEHPQEKEPGPSPRKARDLRPPPNLSSVVHNTDIFLAKFTSKGETVWVRRLGSEMTESVTSIAYRHGVVYVAGKTTGALDGKDTPEGTSDLFATAFNEDGSAAWERPLQIGSGGNDSIQAIALDEGMGHGTTACPYLYIAGRVGGELFQAAPEMKKDDGQCQCHRGNSQVAEDDDRGDDTRRTENLSRKLSLSNSGREFAVNVSAGSNAFRSSRLHAEDVSDMFVAKVSFSGSIVQAAQISLSRNNSADAIAAIGGKLYVAVNSYGENCFDPVGASSLLVLCADDLSYRTVYPDSSYAHAGDFIQSMATDQSGNVFLAGLTTHNITNRRGGVLVDGNFIIRKYSSAKRKFVWETQIGSSRYVPRPKVSISIGKQTNSIYAAGHGRGFFEAYYEDGGEDAKGTLCALSQDDIANKTSKMKRGLLRTGLTILSPLLGTELITWDLLVKVPEEYEDIQAIALDGTENLVYTGRRLNRNDWTWDACLGSFGSERFSSQSRAVNRLQLQNKEQPPSPTISSQQGAGALLIGLVCMAASISIMLVAAVFVMTRTWVLSRRGVMAPDGGFYYEDSARLSKFEELAQKAHQSTASSEDFGNSVVAGVSSRSVSQGPGSLTRRSTRSRDRSKILQAPGGSAEPV